MVKKLSELEHVVLSYPEYDMTGILLKGAYEGYVSIKALPHDALEEMNIPMKEGGTLPMEGGPLEFIYGNGIATMFYERGTDKGYWETGELPDIDFAEDSMFLVLDQDAYYSSQETDVSGQTDTGDGTGGRQTPATVQKHVVGASGLVEGGPDEYNSYYYYAYCDLDALRQVLKKEFSGRVIPGQPSTKSGKPYKEFYYTSAQVKVDDIENVDAVAESIRQMGYNVETECRISEQYEKGVCHDTGIVRRHWCHIIVCGSHWNCQYDDDVYL